MDISIIMPVYNGENYIRKAVESVLRQKNVEWELWLVDDGSTDQSSKICDEYARNNRCIHVIHKKNEGPGIARNIGIDNANGEYIFFLDCDDWLLDGALSYLYELASEKAADIVCYGIKKTTDRNLCCNLVISERVYEYHGEDVLRRYFSNMTASICKLFRKTIFEKHRFEPVKLCEDAWSMHLFFAQANCLVVTHTMCYVQYFHADSRSREEFSEKEFISEECGKRMVAFARHNSPGTYGEALYNLIRRQLHLLYRIEEKGKYKQYKEQYLQLIDNLSGEKEEAGKYKEINIEAWKLLNFAISHPVMYRYRDKIKVIRNHWKRI